MIFDKNSDHMNICLEILIITDNFVKLLHLNRINRCISIRDEYVCLLAMSLKI